MANVKYTKKVEKVRDELEDRYTAYSETRHDEKLERAAFRDGFDAGYSKGSKGLKVADGLVAALERIAKDGSQFTKSIAKKALASFKKAVT